MISPDPDCRLCGLCAGRTNIVLPSGPSDARVVLVGEGPGENEDLIGTPFIGRAGRILEAAMDMAGFSRDDVMITNTVKCRPPSNRDPTPEEMEACRPFLMSELEGRDLIVGLGKSACRDLLGEPVAMKEVANITTTIDINGTPVDFLPTYHPAACIYSKIARERLAEAMAIVRDRL